MGSKMKSKIEQRERKKKKGEGGVANMFWGRGPKYKNEVKHFLYGPVNNIPVSIHRHVYSCHPAYIVLTRESRKSN